MDVIKFGGPEDDEAQVWQEEELLSSMARLIDRQERQEEIARRQRSFWARDILLKELWERIKRRRELLRWSRQILTVELEKVIQVRRLIFVVLEEAVHRAEKFSRLKEGTGM